MRTATIACAAIDDAVIAAFRDTEPSPSIRSLCQGESSQPHPLKSSKVIG